ncbi:hypothetical protein, partial [Burkholderia contaminans]|uniref:hypothetical protein n=1 Tax=Burkholderia contaminans TaxID=488447 RepID=UPI001C2E6C83
LGAGIMPGLAGQSPDYRGVKIVTGRACGTVVDGQKARCGGLVGRVGVVPLRITRHDIKVLI